MKRANRFLLVPDSFKGTMSAQTVCEIMRGAILALIPDAEVCSAPVADGGEGTVDCFVTAVGAEKVLCPAVNPRNEPIESFYGRLKDGTAVVEMAAAAGLPLMEGRLDAVGATTFGVGLLIDHAVRSGARRVILGLGGSATTDGGTGAAAALGAVFRDKGGKPFLPVGATLKKIAAIDLSGLRERLRGVEFTVMCDIDNPLCGPRGAAHIFSAQKGATPKQAVDLDAGLRHLASCVDGGAVLSECPGMGAAGGMGFGAAAFFGGKLQGGIQTVLDTVQFDQLLEGTDLIFTGEGKLDGQSLGGKVVIGVARRARAKGVPTVAVVGGADEGIDAVYGEGVSAVFPINRLPLAIEIARHKSEENLRATMSDIIRLWQLS